ncbi:uncharacterized protein LOC133908781 [Phragmites australis]|uniref:uncharacterized protein LOC133908781 n=1 Tax=Phragmites australis TaxID=29695 RepID=UPI002D78ADE6|nr:uncharacterized protein LOC133908781 [Phragmites australis]
MKIKYEKILQKRQKKQKKGQNDANNNNINTDDIDEETMQKKPRKLKKRKVNYKRSPKEVKNPAEIEQPNQYASLDNENKHETNAEKVKEDNEGITGISNSDEGRKKEQKIKNPAKIEQPNQYASLDNENKHETNAEEVKEDNEGITGISNSDEGRKKEQKIKIPAEIEHRNQYASLDNKVIL